MCGIVVSVVSGGAQDASFDELCNANTSRGPDSFQVVKKTIHGTSSSINVSIAASVLHLRGDHVVPQPHTDSAGNVFCWNGEIFEGLDINLGDNDGLELFLKLTQRDANVVQIFSQIEGPYAFSFYQASTKSLFFGRDPLGRRSLLIRQSNAQQPQFQIVSVSTGELSYNFEEVPAGSIFELRIHELKLGTGTTNTALPITSHIRSSLDRYSSKLSLNGNLELLNQPEELGGAVDVAVDALIERLLNSVSQRTLNIPPRNPALARLGILFSGGIDCAVLAFLAHRYIPVTEPIDLLNVAFENPRALKASRTNQPEVGIRDVYLVPDRVTGLDQLEELRQLCPSRTWNFVKVDVPYEDSARARPLIEKLMFPARTVMDLSLAMALYFASRGIGTIHGETDGNGSLYTSTARVLLSGLGSDELLGGYSRHKAAFRQDKWPGLLSELQLDLDRLPSRNLGRDDRVISSNAKETRYPYLSLPLVAYLAALPAPVKLDPHLEDGIGDKRLLRLVALKLGLTRASERRKRAMQFGSRSAKMTGDSSERQGDLLLPNRKN